MEGLTLAFVLLPCIGAVVAGYLLNDWRLAAAAAAGGGGLVFLLVAMTHPYAVLALPVAGGVALGSLAVLPLLFLRPDTSVWSRMTLALAVTFFASFANLLMMTGRT